MNFWRTCACEPHRKHIVTLDDASLHTVCIVTAYCDKWKSWLNFQLESPSRGFTYRVMEGIKFSQPEAWCYDDLEWRGSIEREWQIIVCSIHIVTSLFTTRQHQKRPVFKIHMFSWTNIDCQTEKRWSQSFSAKNCSPTCCILLDQMFLSNLSLSIARITERALEVHALPVRATSGTFVPHGSERTLGRYLTAPVTLPPPPPTSDNLLRQGARARAAHDCVRGTHSHVYCCIPG